MMMPLLVFAVHWPLHQCITDQEYFKVIKLYGMPTITNEGSPSNYIHVQELRNFYYKQKKVGKISHCYKAKKLLKLPQYF